MTTQTTRRAALAAAPDPVFEKVAKYKTARDDLHTFTEEPVDAAGRPNSKAAEYKVWQAAQGRLCDLLTKAEDDLVSTQPRTRAGAAAMVRAYLEVTGPAFGDKVTLTLLENLLAHLEGADV